MADDVVLVHTSDLHLGSEVYGGDQVDGDGLELLGAVLAAAEDAHLLLVVGDMFENNRLSLPILEAAANLLAAAASIRVVILPGNHDPLTSDSVYRRGPIAEAPNVSVLGLSAEASVFFPEWDLEVWGRAHYSYSDMFPFADPPPRTTRWRIALAHGQYHDPAEGTSAWWPSWRFRAEHLETARADYVALGHWNRAAQVGDAGVRAYYCGSPDLAGTVNLVRLGRDGQVHVTRQPLERMNQRDQ